MKAPKLLSCRSETKKRQQKLINKISLLFAVLTSCYQSHILSLLTRLCALLSLCRCIMNWGTILLKCGSTELLLHDGQPTTPISHIPYSRSDGCSRSKRSLRPTPTDFTLGPFRLTFGANFFRLTQKNDLALVQLIPQHSLCVRISRPRSL